MCGVGCVLSVCGAAWQPACVETCARGDGTHGSVFNVNTETFFNLHTGRREGGGVGGVLFSIFLTSLLSISPLFLLSLPSLVFSLCSLCNKDNDHSSSRLSLCTHGSNLSECLYFGSFPVWRTCSYHARNNCPDITVQASCHLE